MSNRYEDNGNGTITDNQTGLIWLKNANGFDQQDWETAKQSVDKLADGECGLSDGSKAGDWRLPTKEEWEAMVDKRYKEPALSNAEGEDQWKEDDAFSGVQTFLYLSSTADAKNTNNRWAVNFGSGYMSSVNKTSKYFMWPVRG